MELDERIIKYLCACPPAIAGNQGHTTTLLVANALYNGFALDETQMVHFMGIYNERCSPPWSEKELLHKISEASKSKHPKPRGHLLGNGTFKKAEFNQASIPPKVAPKPKVAIDPCTFIENFLKGRTCAEADLWEASPLRPPDDFQEDGVFVLENLYSPGEIINFVTDYKIAKLPDGTEKANPIGYGQSLERNELIDLWSLGMPKSKAGGWQRMNPVDGHGIKDENVTALRFVLLEFDSIPLDLQLRLLGHLPLPISLIMSSGGKSMHAWVKVDAPTQADYEAASNTLLNMLERFGLDPTNKNPSRLSRLPGVTRTIGAKDDPRQRVIFCNPKPEQKPIL